MQWSKDNFVVNQLELNRIELFNMDVVRDENGEPKIGKVSFNKIDWDASQELNDRRGRVHDPEVARILERDFRDNPGHVIEAPIIAQKDNGLYQIISGMMRSNVGRKLGFDHIYAIRVEGWDNWAEVERLASSLNQHGTREPEQVRVKLAYEELKAGIQPTLTQAAKCWGVPRAEVQHLQYEDHVFDRLPANYRERRDSYLKRMKYKSMISKLHQLSTVDYFKDIFDVVVKHPVDTGEVQDLYAKGKKMTADDRKDLWDKTKKDWVERGLRNPPTSVGLGNRNGTRSSARLTPYQQFRKKGDTLLKACKDCENISILADLGVTTDDEVDHLIAYAKKLKAAIDHFTGPAMEAKKRRRRRASKA